MQFKELITYLQSLPDATISVGHFSRDGNKEFFYPQKFLLNNRLYNWSIGSRKTKGRSMSSHYELWLHGGLVGDLRVCTLGNFGLKKHHLFKAFKIVYCREFLS